MHGRDHLHVAVAGAGMAGLATALVLARDGHRVTLVERDRLTAARASGDPAPNGTAAAGTPDGPGSGPAGDRRGTPQVRHSHAFLGRLRKLLAAELPDLLDELHAAGATDYQVLDDLPDTVEDRSPRPGDEDLILLACRRATFEHVLRRVALAEPGVELIDGTAVTGLEIREDPAGTGPPTVTGLRLEGDGPAHLRADVVVGAGGPRAAVGDWMSGAGVRIPESAEESGIVYLTRFYRQLSGEPAAGDPGSAAAAAAGGGGGGDVLGLTGADLGYIKCAVFRGDNRTFSVTLAPRSDDEGLRSALRDADRFQRAAAMFGPIAPWVDPERAEPLTDVYAMARLGNRQRHFLDRDGRPLVRGFHAVGDAHTSTNPLYGRGCTMAVVQATLLARALRDEPADADARAVAYERANDAEIAPWYDVAVIQDRFNRQLAEQARAAREARESGSSPSSGDGTGGSSGTDTGEVDGATFLGKVVRDGLLPASRTDPVVARAFLRVVNALQTPQSLLEDADVTGRIMRTMADPPPNDLAIQFRVRRRDLLAAIS